MKEILIAQKAARKAGAFLKKNFGRDHKFSYKSMCSDLVSYIDLKSDKIICDILKEETNFNILSEESGFLDRGSDFTWVVDSLDGSANYLNNIPFFACSIGLAKKGVPVIGVIFNPIAEEMFFGAQKTGAFLNKKKLHITHRPLKDSVINSDFGRHSIKKILQWIDRLAMSCRYFRVCGSSVLAMCDVASERSQVYIQDDLKPWDGCAGTAIIKAAGGKVTNLDGKPWKITDKGFVAAHPKLYKEIFKIL
jgi:myo-inositol-1(or 4)-monophosphatase